MPGPYPGRVIEVRNPRMIKNDVKNREAIKEAVDRGMKELTGADDAVSAWRAFFEPGDVVGVKMNPVGNPLANSSSELMLEVIDGLKAAGVKTKDIVVFERYRDEFIGRQDARGRSRRHRLVRAGRRVQRPPDRPQGRGQPQDRQPRPA